MEGAIENAKLSIEAQELELKRQAQMIDAQDKGITTQLRTKKSDADRTSREALKQLDVMTKMNIEEEKLDLEKQKLIMESTKDQATIEQKLKKEIDKDALEKQKLIMESAKDQAIIEQKREAAKGKQATDRLTKLNKGEKDA